MIELAEWMLANGYCKKTAVKMLAILKDDRKRTMLHLETAVEVEVGVAIKVMGRVLEADGYVQVTGNEVIAKLKALLDDPMAAQLRAKVVTIAAAAAASAAARGLLQGCGGRGGARRAPGRRCCGQDCGGRGGGGCDAPACRCCAPVAAARPARQAAIANPHAPAPGAAVLASAPVQPPVLVQPPALTDALTTYEEMCKNADLTDVAVLERMVIMIVRPAQVYFQRVFVRECGDQLKCLFDARVFDPLHVSATGVHEADVDSLVKSYRFFSLDEFKGHPALMKSELVSYRAAVAEIPALAVRKNAAGKDTFDIEA